jgi:hypothetical protein
MTMTLLLNKCRKHWKNLGIKDEKSLQEHINSLFDKGEDQAKLVIALYRLVFPEFDEIEKIDGIEVGTGFWQYICDQFICFDKKHHPECMAGGAWLNWGFSVSSKLSPWEISFKNCTITPKN